MSRRHAENKEAQPEPDGVAAPWPSLTWQDLEDWAGSRSVSRGRSYQRSGRVSGLALAADGRLLATVAGTHRYNVSVWLTKRGKGEPRLESVCTCAVGESGCKHAVAVVAQFLDSLADGPGVPAADPNDGRWAKLHDDPTAEWDSNDDDDAAGDEYDDFVEEDEDDEGSVAESGQHPARHSRRSKRERCTPPEFDAKIQSLICNLDRAELVTLVWSLVRRFPELHAEFKERVLLSDENVARLVGETRKELRKVTAEIGWVSHWGNEVHLPDYNSLKRRLARLVEFGQADEVVKLGRELIERGMKQVGQSDDEGETGSRLADCLEIVFRAVAASSLEPADKILFVIDACLADDYGLLGDSIQVVFNAPWTQADWSAVADRLAARLQENDYRMDEDSFSAKYHRDQVSGWLITALENAGRGNEVSPIYQAEARTTGSYERLVRHLIDEGRIDEAERWAREGIEKTDEKLPGIAASLRRMLCDVARGRKQWGIVATHAAASFFERPSAAGFEELLAAARKAKCEGQVRTAALVFLETGKPPICFVIRKGKAEPVVDAAWPLPSIDYLAPRSKKEWSAERDQRPHWGVLLDMAIADKRPVDILKWYDKMIGNQRRSSKGLQGWQTYPGNPYTDRIAAAVAVSHPDRALEIYQRGLDSRLPHADYSAYEACAEYLEKMRPIYQAIDRDEDWQAIVQGIREKYGNRPRFMEVLDRLEGRSILESQAVARRRKNKK